MPKQNMFAFATTKTNVFGNYIMKLIRSRSRRSTACPLLLAKLFTGQLFFCGVKLLSDKNPQMGSWSEAPSSTFVLLSEFHQEIGCAHAQGDRGAIHEEAFARSKKGDSK